jgi:hypothetical protein
MKLRPLYIFISLFFFCSCDSIFLDEQKSNNPINNFELCWKLLDENYCFFNDKNINWQQVYNKYRPAVKSNTNEVELFNILASMLNELEDGHVNLRSDFNLSRNWDWNLDYPKNYNFEILKHERYLGKDYAIAGGFYTKMIDGIPYIHFPTFSNAINTNSLDLYLSAYHFYKDKFNNSPKGIIIDIRDNGGGLVSNVDRVASRFTNKKRLVGYTRYKNGKSHDDFTEKFPTYVSPKGANYFADKKVILITNRSVYSAANELTAIFKQFPNVEIYGDKSGGGGGMPVSNQLYNGWTLRYSAHQFLTPDNKQVEFGIDPDVKLDMNASKMLLFHDSILDAAIEKIKNL